LPLIASEDPLDCVPHQAHAWALSEYLAAGLGDARIADLSYGQLKDFLTVSGKCLRAELDWARTKFALVVLTEMKSIDLTPLLNTCGPPKPIAQLDSRFDVEQGADPEDAAAARETASDYRRAMGDTAKRVHRAATAARERAIQASNAEKADLHAELAALASPSPALHLLIERSSGLVCLLSLEIRVHIQYLVILLVVVRFTVRINA